MAVGINKVILIGNVGKDPDVRAGRDGDIVNFSLATSESWKDKTTGERKDQVEWHRIVVFNENLAAVCKTMLQKGTRVYIEGKLRTRKWQNQAGMDIYTTEVILERFHGQLIVLGGAKQLNQEPPPYGEDLRDQNAAMIDAAASVFDNDDIPF